MVTENSQGAQVSPSGGFGQVTGRLLVAICIPIAWMGILAAHYSGNPDQATGFIQYDQPYYVANGRAAFDRGNGVLYPNPSDADADAPVIYFHWLPWILGFLVSRLGVEPGTAYSGLNIAMLPVFALLTWQLVRHRTHTHRLSVWTLALWGGGLLSFVGILKGTWLGKPLDRAVFEFDPTEGLWFLNWGRNAVYGVEITYHCVVAVVWLLVLKGYHRAALVPAALLGMTHPWSGLETLLVLNAWYFLTAVTDRNGRSLVSLGSAIGLLCLLLGYYKLWLPQFPAHAALQENWSLNWRAEWSTVLYAYGPVALLALSQLARKEFRLDRSEQFLLCAAAVAFVLTIHDRILPRAIQPLHFTRGYVWMPLFLIAAPQLVRFLDGLKRLPSLQRHIVFACALLVACFDNLAFTVTHAVWQYNGTEGFRLTADDRAAIRELEQYAQNRVVFCESLDVGYLLPTYAPVRPWLCHKFNTPHYVARQKELRPVIADDRVRLAGIPSSVDVLLLKAARDVSELDQSDQWLRVPSTAEEWQIWQRSELVSDQDRRSLSRAEATPSASAATSSEVL